MDADHFNNNAINTSNDDKLTLKQHTSSSIISFATVSSLLDKPVPTYINTTTATTALSTATTKSGDETSSANKEIGDDGLIYYKRREDFYPQFTNEVREENESVSTFTNTQQSRRQTIQ